MDGMYTGKQDDRRYTGEAIDISYSQKRCIHAAECGRRLSEVFDTSKRPWINADGASADRAAEVIERCPSGALHYKRKDGGPAETVPTRNRIILWRDGPIQISGDLEIHGATVEIPGETRVTLCRCGDSGNKPFCDNAHKTSGFTAPATITVNDRRTGEETSGKLRITAHAGGPLEFDGNFEIVTREGETLYTGTRTWLCRCGQSNRKPFCDGTHKTVGFSAE
ncbi:MAG: CDGSH iron-sulfur domain-containing protein [Chloroflexota bacterium]